MGDWLTRLPQRCQGMCLWRAAQLAIGLLQQPRAQRGIELRERVVERRLSLVTRVARGRAGQFGGARRRVAAEAVEPPTGGIDALPLQVHLESGHAIAFV